MQQPNILFILIDDMGQRDIGCYGSTFYETPNLDRFAAQGMLFENGYAACPVCSPSRASLLTGRYPARLGITQYIMPIESTGHPDRGKLVDAPYLRELRCEEQTVATMLRDGGYQTWHVGKWHLGREPYWPLHHGFDENVAGCDWGAPHGCGYFSPWGLPTMSDGPDGEYLTDRLTDEAIALLRRRDPSRPFFLNLWHYAVHTPIEAPEPLVAKYREKARRLRLDQMPAMVEGEHFPTEAKGHLRVKRRIIQSDPAYAAMVENLDTNVGRLLAVLDELGLADDTVVIFTSDNGGLATSEGSPTCNAPLAEGKGWMYDGGTREPWLVRYPRVVRPGSRCAVPITSTDLCPTLLDLAGLPPRPERHCDGLSLLPLLREEPEFTDRPIFWHFPHYANQGGTPGSSVRWGEWKLIEFFEDGRLELYNLVDDVSESRNQAAEQPAVTARLKAALDGWRDDVEALFPTVNQQPAS